jgi:alpha-ketoglutarate-dependent taurine dioxygenase
MVSADSITVTPLQANFGARVTLPEYASNDPSKLNDADHALLYEALHTYSVLLIPNQKDLLPKSQYKLTARLDPTLTISEDEQEGEKNYGHGKEFRHKDSVLKKDGMSIPNQPQVQVLGQGKWTFEEEGGHYGIKECQLTHPTHLSFHKDVLAEDQIKDGQTRFYRWHIDSALYELSPPIATTLLGIHVPPRGKLEKIIYDDGEVLELAQGATAFVSGRNAFRDLSEEDKEIALNTTVIYAPHPYIFISPAKATSDGITMVSEGKEKKLDELPEWEESKVKRLPMVWTNPVTGEHHLQVHGCCIHRLENNKTGKVLELKEARDEVYRFMRPSIAKDKVYVHNWTEGDLVIFHNRGVWHSVTGQFGPGEKRLMHQCNIASSQDPVCVR